MHGITDGTYRLVSEYDPKGDQPKAIMALTDGVLRGDRWQTLLGVTGSGKTFTVSNVIAQVDKPVLVMSHNKTLAAQLYGELRQFFPDNAVEYFVSYYDFYQPEAYLPALDKYIAKDLRINDEIERLRLKTTSSLLSGRRDVIVVSSVSCIYGLGSPDDWKAQIVELRSGMEKDRDLFLQELVSLHYIRDDVDPGPGKFRVRGDIIDLVPAHEELALRVEFFGSEIESLQTFNIQSGELLGKDTYAFIYPARQFIAEAETLKQAMVAIENELAGRLNELRRDDRLVEARRLEERTRYDLEMMKELGYCSGIENYSRHLAGRSEGERPYCLLDYFPEDFLVIVDESHVTLPQIRGMYGGDRSRKAILVEHGFRLPSALDNRPLRFEEFTEIVPQVICVSATPGDLELERCGGVVVEQLVRPTGLLDPPVEVRPVKGQIDDLLAEIRRHTAKGHKALVMTLTKRMSEDLDDYFKKVGIRSRYLHSEIKSLERIQILRELRAGDVEVLVGVNLLREGLDLPEVSLVAILDADKEGFLRNTRSLMQIAGRAARNVDGFVVFYADVLTRSIMEVLDETARRRTVQQLYNETHGITPRSIRKSLDQVLNTTSVADAEERYRRKRFGLGAKSGVQSAALLHSFTPEESYAMVAELRLEMNEAAIQMEYEKAAYLRDEIARLMHGLEAQSDSKE
ncbi:excinuclease ABC subunit UvrB [Chlorobium phaeobacteroides]|jgi:excinuclease ABC subunit B|uniref:UvrABC system protein B n=1 Tax=Chlorobium phaeobacteroides (strain DSM 266 / SMG 266 / 2430) TaxID=290317 RepID=UVRB_CHLPD|nr:excinuclease ABC subunit UvrB [Chlorobium phaeobacteroides]A1BI09.1 RecName: Full=UvrABC system protein B; Short=Protein UvrB; AltName: Full=Excinuclease ABC subunit B [Chlorobium phaeobacteroides DSM 266]ABL66036.1 Excinuclease ABC subunit B [Chlorobium phaeobacteroides DSM 266]MBV5326460.1 excinuclease ABC subunit UvrB [Chlorobium sp.]